MSILTAFLAIFTVAEPPQQESPLRQALERADREVAQARDMVRGFIRNPKTDARTIAANVENVILNGSGKEEPPRKAAAG